jgi:hypothetical protein
MSRQELLYEARKDAILRLKNKLNSKKINMQSQNLVRHRAVLSFMQMQQSKQLGEIREEMSFAVARCYGKVVTWELQYLRGENIEEGKRGCGYSKTRSWFNDEGVQLAVREWISGKGEGMCIEAYQ